MPAPRTQSLHQTSQPLTALTPLAPRRSAGRSLIRAGAALAAAGALVAVGATAHAAQLPGVDGGAAAPTFLEADELPPASTGWTAGEVGAGTGDPRFCLPEELPQDGSHHREFRTELETSAHQLVLRAEDAEAAEELADRLNAAVEKCASGFEQENPDATAEYKDFGAVPVRGGGWVHGVTTDVPNSAKDVHLIGVGLNGDRVTVVGWGEYGSFDDAPSKAFHSTLETAMVNLD
ncbi:hypothetical protein MTQ01_20855 [Streptomyces sp. XM4193]|uniref:hypothetical protein n=1 Tax=Streptomyces sp. XM4193 TaxID=2929782 RepID=UPI001FFAB538|nr:hypothetical protein [Streptomyces sp. XM4193]MCK1798431.1 hypothetical protein [Streptomyces sp. XM4193]